ncbi:hypothetical protein LJ737_23440 [Hymenobacter sp. 15J16-1T3B]|uniref:hypothetical protein n=1 Tax=Hymenobacter sp. 15J16-1T3B TaxID=2886941 RepID=UPI001D100CD0|nr:hypothetical protein [Hymenobacter sp. 15J16-1T3B]MCC3160210.1 hypothetical protein [Hymenobacter sp. 15J16-1T3B]
MHFPHRDLEPICYEPAHIAAVQEALRQGLEKFFPLYTAGIETQKGHSSGYESFASHDYFKVRESRRPEKNGVEAGVVLTTRANSAIEEFEDDRADYEQLLSEEMLELSGEDVPSFKATALRNQCPIIRKTLQNKKAKKLDRYRQDFSYASPSDLYTVVNNVALFGREYAVDYQKGRFLKINTLSALSFDELDTEDYTVFGVIGGGIKSHFLYKLYPHIFPYRSQDAIWALWFLTDKATFGCRQDSEFLMISEKEGTTQQNFYYPYALFSLYALNLSRQLQAKWEQAGAAFPEQYRFVLLHDFLSFVARCHDADINVLKQAEAFAYGDAY